jgi:hypothetical protein
LSTRQFGIGKCKKILIQITSKKGTAFKTYASNE